MSDELDPELLSLEERLREAHATLAPRAGLQDELRPRPATSRGLPWQGFAAAAAVLLAVGGVGFLLSGTHLGGGGGAASSGAGHYQLAIPAGGFGALPRWAPAGGAAQGAGAFAPLAGGTNDSTKLAPAPLPLPSSALVYRWSTPSGAVIDSRLGAPSFSVDRTQGARCGAPVFNALESQQVALNDLRQAQVKFTWAYTAVGGGSSVTFVRLFSGYQFVDQAGTPAGITVQLGCGFRASGLSDLALQSATYRLISAPEAVALVYVGVPDGAVGYFEPVYRRPDGTLTTALTSDELRP